MTVDNFKGRGIENNVEMFRREVGCEIVIVLNWFSMFLLVTSYVDSIKSQQQAVCFRKFQYLLIAQGKPLILELFAWD
jgi:hypothetical protein